MIEMDQPNGYRINIGPVQKTHYVRKKNMNQSDDISELAKALSKCQGEMEPAIKDSLNPHYKSRYADLSSVWAACRVPLSKNGLCVIQTMDNIDDKLVLITTLMHSSGQWIRSIMPVISAKQDAQGIGSGLSYARRYSLSAICGISQDDDDGEAASAKEKIVREVKPKAPESPKEKTIFIDVSEIAQLNEVSDKCDEEYLGKLWAYLPSEGINDLSEIPKSMFNKILNGLVKNAELNAKKN